MKYILILLLLLSGFKIDAQFSNSWTSENKTTLVEQSCSYPLNKDFDKKDLLNRGNMIIKSGLAEHAEYWCYISCSQGKLHLRLPEDPSQNGMISSVSAGVEFNHSGIIFRNQVSVQRYSFPSATFYAVTPILGFYLKTFHTNTFYLLIGTDIGLALAQYNESLDLLLRKTRAQFTDWAEGKINLRLFMNKWECGISIGLVNGMSEYIAHGKSHLNNPASVELTGAYHFHW